MKNRFKSYTFWVSLSSAVVILVQSLAELFGFSFETSIVENVIMAVCGVLVVLGIVNKTSQTEDETVEQSDEDNQTNETELVNEEDVKETVEVDMNDIVDNDENNC